MVISYLYNLFKNSQITQKQYNVLILDTFFERKSLIFNDFRFFVVKIAPKLHRFKNFPARFLHRLTLISEIAPPLYCFFSCLEPKIHLIAEGLTLGIDGPAAGCTNGDRA